MPTNRKQRLIVFSDQAESKLAAESQQSGDSVQEVVRRIVDRHFRIKTDVAIVRGRPRKGNV